MDGVRTLVDAGVTFVVATHDGAVRRLADEVMRARSRSREGDASGGAARVPAPAARYYAAGRLPGDDFEAAVSVHELTKVFRHHGGDVVHALESVSFEARPGELVGLVGRSGSGKTTLLNVIAGWERPESGEVRWREPVDASSPPWSASWRSAAEARTDGGAHGRGEHRVSRPAGGHARGSIGRHRGADRGARDRRAPIPVPA